MEQWHLPAYGRRPNAKVLTLNLVALFSLNSPTPADANDASSKICPTGRLVGQGRDARSKRSGVAWMGPGPC